MPPYDKRSPAMFAQTKGSLVQRELARQRLRDCKGLEFAEQKRKKIVFVGNNPSAALRAAPPLTQGRLRNAPPECKIKFPNKREGRPLPYGVLVFAGMFGACTQSSAPAF